jgi:hypothetical protein
MRRSIVRPPVIVRIGSSGTRRLGAVVAAAICAALLAPAAVAPAASAAGSASPSCPWLDQSLPIPQRVQMLMSSMTLANKINMVTGGGFSEPYVFYIPGIPSLCIPAMGQEDGPLGVGDGLTGVTQLPGAVSLAATFDPDSWIRLRLPAAPQGQQRRSGLPRAAPARARASHGGVQSPPGRPRSWHPTSQPPRRGRLRFARAHTLRVAKRRLDPADTLDPGRQR